MFTIHLCRFLKREAGSNYLCITLWLVWMLCLLSAAWFWEFYFQVFFAFNFHQFFTQIRRWRRERFAWSPFWQFSTSAGVWWLLCRFVLFLWSQIYHHRYQYPGASLQHNHIDTKKQWRHHFSQWKLQRREHRDPRSAQVKKKGLQEINSFPF